MLRKVSVVVFLFAFAGGLMITGLAAHAWQAEPATEGHGGMGKQGKGAMTPENRLKMLTEKLNLTDDQQAKIKPLLEDETSEMQSIHNDSSLAPADRQAKMKQVHQSFTDKVNAVLTPDQQTKWKQMKQEKMEKYKGMKGDNDHQ